MLNEDLISSDSLSQNSIPSTQHFGGQKTIGFWGGFNLLANNICGPAIVLLPGLFQQAGIIPTTFGLISITILAAICSWMLVEAMKLIPGNKHLNHRHEYMTIADRFLSRPHYWIVFFFYQISAMSILISNVLQTAQVFDIAIADIFGCSYGFSYYPHFATFPCGDDNNNIEPWSSDWVFSIGFVIVALISVPFGILNLDDNIILQWIATIGFGIMAIVWIIIFIQQPTFNTDHVPWYTSNMCPQLIGIILFNYGYIVTIPSWANEKKTNVSVKRTLAVSLGYVLIVFYVVGLFGGMAYKPYYNTNEDIFNQLQNSKGDFSLTAKITVYLEPIIQNVTSIPIFCIVIRYNLLDAGFSKWSANFWSIVFPWVIAIPLYNGNGFSDLCNWAGVILAAYVNFIIPPYLFIWAYMEKAAERLEPERMGVDNENRSIFKGEQIKQSRNALILAWITYVLMWIISLVGIFFTLYDQFRDSN